MSKNYSAADLDIMTPPKQRDKLPHDQFMEFREKHQAIYEIFKKLATRLLIKGHKRWSSDAIIHYIRTAWALEHPPEGVEIKKRGKVIGREVMPTVNDHFVCSFGDALMAEDKRFDGFFRKVRKNKE